MNRIIAAALTSFCLVSSAIAGAQSNSGQVLTLAQCLAIAKTNNLALQQVQKARRIAELSRKEISGTAYPQVKLEAGGTYAPINSGSGYDPVITDQGQLSAQIVVEQSVYDGGIRGLRKAQTDLDIRRLAKVQQLAMRDLEFYVTQAFVELLRSQSEIALRTEGESTLSDYYLLVKSLNAAGTVGYTDVLSTQSRLLSDSLAMVQAAQIMATNKLSLAELIGNAGDTSYALAGTLDDMSYISIDTLNVPASFDSLQNLALSVARLDHKRTQFDVRAAQREIIPTLSLTGDLGYLSSHENLLLSPPERINGIGYEIGIALEMPIFDWGERSLRIQKLQLASDSLQLQTEILRRSLLTEYRKALAELLSARKNLHLAEEAINAASDNSDLAKAKYAGGSALTLEVLEAYQILTEARLSRIEILAEMAISGAKIQRINANE